MVQPSFVRMLSLALSMRQWFIYLVHYYSQAAAVIPQHQLRAFIQREEKYIFLLFESSIYPHHSNLLAL